MYIFMERQKKNNVYSQIKCVVGIIACENPVFDQPFHACCVFKGPQFIQTFCPRTHFILIASVRNFYDTDTCLLNLTAPH